jgi:hypothetical protein
MLWRLKMSKMNRGTTLLAMSAAALLLAPGAAHAITVDGLAGDWGVSGLGSDTADYSGVVGTAWETTAFEDDGNLAPGAGGQNYDVEFMSLYIEGNTLYGIVMSGQRADNGDTLYSPGDVFFTAYDANLGADVLFGLEVDGNTYDLTSSGYTDAVHAGSYAAATLVRDPGTVSGVPFGDSGSGGSEYAQIVSPGSGTSDLGAIGAFTFNQDPTLGQHSVIEFAIDLAMFDLGTGGFIKSATWAPSCGNDHGLTTVPPIPEPNGAWLMAVGIVVAGAGRMTRGQGA